MFLRGLKDVQRAMPMDRSAPSAAFDDRVSAREIIGARNQKMTIDLSKI
jgi:hypothetical protein